MIEFDGVVSEKNQLDRMKMVDKRTRYTFLFGLLFIWIIIIAVSLPAKIFQDIWKEGVFCSVVILGITFLTWKTPPTTALRFRLSPHIIITKKELALELWSNGKRVWRKRKISKVKKIFDCGEVYYLIFKFGDITNSWMCQKDNMIQGSIEEFEELFQGKIVRRYKSAK